MAFSQQITIDNTFTEQQLIENNLIQGCVETSNISSQVNGSVNGFSSFGYFERGTTNFPFENGIMLSTGNAVSGANGQNNTILNEGESSWLTDADLETALGITGTLNATSIEFDFISVTNQLQFNYILASEEYYGNFPCQYSDGFAFLIKEAGTSNPYQNIAVIPGTNTPVNTNTIHDEIIGFCDAENGQYFDGYNVGDTNYNGRTKVMSAIATILPNVQYHIKLVIADQTDENYDSAVFIEGNSFSSSVDLGNDITTCGDSVELNGDIQNPQATYSWYLNNSLINGETQTALEASQSGIYTVRVEIPFSNSTCVIEDTVEVILSATQNAELISDYELCDDASGDAIESFDLSIKDTEVLASVPASNYSYTYHLTSLDAQNNVNAILTSIQNTSNPQTVYVRIEDIDNGCLAYTTFNLVVNSLPVVIAPTDLEVCDDTNSDGITQIDLSQKDDEITNGNTDLVVKYHYTQIDAENGVNAIGFPYVNTNPTELIFVRVFNTLTSCYTTTTLTVTVFNNPSINTEDHYIDACDQDHDGFAAFDLTSIIDEVLEGLTGVSTSFYETYQDAIDGTNPIVNETNYENIIADEQIIYIRVENTNTGCASVTPIELHTNLLLTATNIRDFSLCDIDNDNSEAFNLSNIAIEIINTIPGITVEFYENQTDRDNQTNALDQSILYSPTNNPQTLYLTLSNASCSEAAEINLIINPIIVFDSIGYTEYCDTDQDGFTSIYLPYFNSLVTEGQNGFSVRYFLTETDADTNSNPLPSNYTNTTNPLTVYTRISYGQTGCGSVNSFEIEVLPAPMTTAPSQIIICDDDQDAVYVVDLTQKITEIISDTTNRTVSFHNTQGNANNNTNPIANPSAYSSNTQTVFIRVENNSTGCYSTESLDIIINTVPVIGTINSYINQYSFCEDYSDGIGEFIFVNKDAEILNGQYGKIVSYYLNETDAETKTNAIDKNQIYENISNPQTIFVRVENVTDEDCNAISQFEIEVGTRPLYNEPTDLFTCDDISNDASEAFDLNDVITEISQGISDTLDITFYTSLANAENANNPIALNFNNTVNPQQIYARIDNGTICNSYTSFVLNVIQVPDVNPSEPLFMCDDNYDGINTFNLTDSELNILDVRQDDILIEYFETLEDLEAQTNAIVAPESYTNTSNPQTVLIRITNTLSNCYLTLPLELNVNLPPAINNFETITICDNGNAYYDLTEVNSYIVDSTTNRNITYYTNATDALDGTNAIDTNYNYQSNNDTIHIRIENATTSCFTNYAFQLMVNPLPIANQPSDLEDCDDDFDGFLTFDIAQQNDFVLGVQDPNMFTVSYYTSQNAAENATNALNTNYQATDNDIIYVRIENNATGCYNTTQFAIRVHPRPIIDIEDQVICLENLPLLVSANTNNVGDTYIWSTNETTPEIEITEIGTYWVSIITPFGCETTRVFNVTESEQANIEFTETVDFSDPNNITITVSGIGNYLFILDNGEPQESNIFQNVTIGLHIITIIDLNGCSEIYKEVVVFDTPKFMTPNSDGYFDTWHITGVGRLPGTVITIFDRYGKTLTQLTSTSRGWDGTYNGYNMPASDYWFVADVKKDGTEFQVKGHFALRR